MVEHSLERYGFESHMIIVRWPESAQSLKEAEWLICFTPEVISKEPLLLIV